MKYTKPTLGAGGKLVVLTLATAVICGSAVGGTVAWLTASSGKIVNTFTYGDIRIGLGSSPASLLSLGAPEDTEEDSSVTEPDAASVESEDSSEKKVSANRMVPGKTLELDTTLYVAAGSEACWLFVTVEESENFGDFLTYEMEEGWTRLDPDAEEKVYYREVIDMEGDFRIDALDEDFVTSVIRENELLVRSDVTIEQFDELTEETCPRISITAFAIQRANIDTPETAWEQAGLTKPEEPAEDSAETTEPEVQEEFADAEETADVTEAEELSEPTEEPEIGG